ncbi:hypothetical protein H4R99_000988 [Coemansia sp. RSA 1722]|nr:hypothetical protein IWW45_005484 [Coemansia sp. RSA 485]KAJ2605643.1 hypothetical protein H4R99_000988 [Coemansia sp. RSA 1722]
MSSCPSRKYTLPECHAIPRTKFTLDEDQLLVKKSKVRENPVYQNVKHHMHTQSLAALRRHTQVFLEPEIPHDKQLLYRIFYRNKNQHRGSLYFRRIHELRRALRILDSIKLQEMIRELLRSFGERDRPWTALPCRVYAVQVARRLSEINLFVEKIAEICAVVFAFMETQVRQTLFMPFSLVMQGIVARMFCVFQVWHKDIKALYELLIDWIPALPACVDSIGTKEKQASMLPDAQLLTFNPLKKLVGERRVGIVEDIQACAAQNNIEQMDVVEREDLGSVVSSKSVEKPQKQKRKKQQQSREKKAKRAREMFLDLFE